MSVDQNDVKIARAYHHGDLRAALLAAAERVLAQRGADGFSLRETARLAGVSPSAPAHHFKDTRGLLTALATTAFSDLADALEAADATNNGRRKRVRALGRAYVAFALSSRARFDLMWRSALLDKEDAAFGVAAARAFRALDEAVRPGEGVDQPGAPGTTPSIAAWSIVHGFARLAIDGGFGAQDDALLDDALLDGVLGHLQL